MTFSLHQLVISDPAEVKLLTLGIKSVSSVCTLSFFHQLGSHSSAGTAPIAPPRRATWRPTSSVSTANPLTTASTPTAASDARTRPSGPPDCLRASPGTVARQEETRLAWHHSVGLDVVVATADTDSYDYCFSFTSQRGLGWLRLLRERKRGRRRRKKKNKLTTNLDVHSSVYLKSHSTYLSVAKRSCL